MSELQDAFDKYDKTGSAYGNVGLFVEAARKYANLPDLDDEVRAAVKRAYIAGYTDGVHDDDLPVEWELEDVSVNEWMGDLLVAALGITKDAKQRKTFRDDEGGDLAGGGGPIITEDTPEDYRANCGGGETSSQPRLRTELVEAFVTELLRGDLINQNSSNIEGEVRQMVLNLTGRWDAALDVTEDE